MSGDRTRPMPTPGQYPVYQPAAVRRRSRWPFVVLGVVVLLLLLLVGADRAAAAYAGSQAAQQMKTQGFPGNPDVTMEGFPFLTQVAARNLQDVHVTANNVQEGPVSLSLSGDAYGVRLNPGYQSGTITRVKGTVLIGFGSVASIARNAGASGVTASADGPNRIKFKVDMAVFSTTVIASVIKTGPSTVQFHVISAGGLPASLLGSFGNMTFTIPKLPYGLTVQSLSVTSQGIVGHLTARNIPFSQ